MHKLITLFFISCAFLVGLGGCGVKGPLYQKPDEKPQQTTENISQNNQVQQEK